MAKFLGYLGYVDTVEDPPGIWQESIVEHPHFFEADNYAFRIVNSNDPNDSLHQTLQASIVASPVEMDRMIKIKYIRIKKDGLRWKITKIVSKPPRLELTIDGLYED